MTDRFYWRSALFCFAVNALFGAWLYRFLPAIPLGTSWGVASDTLIGSALLAVFTYYAVTPSVTGMALRGELAGRAAAPESALARFVRLPPWLRAALFALAAVLLFAAPVCGLLAWFAPDGFGYVPFVLFKGAAAGVLGGTLTPLVVAAALVAEPALVKAVPRFPVLDLKLALEFYRERLGFTVLFDWDDYAGVARGGFELHLFRTGDPNLLRSTSCRVNVVGVDALYAELERAGVIHPNGALASQPWGFREFTALDLSGNAIVFGERIA